MLKAGKPYYFHADALGSIIALTDSRGQLIESYRYDAFGTPTILAPDGTVRATSIVGNRFMFTGREYDAETGLCYLRGRYYHPRLGRFLQREPDPTDLNAYRYTFNNPVNWTDPLGLNVFSPTPPAVTGPDVIGLGLPRGLGIDPAPPLPTPPTEWVPPLPNPPTGPDVLPVPPVGTEAGQRKGSKWVGERGSFVKATGGQRDIPTRTPRRGLPNSQEDFPAERGGRITRHYGPDGEATKDIHYGHDHGPGDPHVHDWEGGRPKPGRPPLPGEVP